MLFRRSTRSWSFINLNKNIFQKYPFRFGNKTKKSKDKLPDFSKVKDFGGIDAIIISHAHMDHIGSLPIISKEYPNAPIYMNKMTLELMRVLLYDSLKIMNYSEGEIPIFSEQDVLNMLERVRVIPYQNEINISDNITLTLYMAGHIAGAAVTYLKSSEGTVLYTGDYSLFNQHTISRLSIPKLHPDVVISEATYGDRLHSNREIEEQHLIEAIKEIIARGGKVLIPAFAKELTGDIHSNVIAPFLSETIELEIRNPRKQINNKLSYLFSQKSDNLKDFYQFIKDNYGEMLFTKEDLSYIYYGYKPEDNEIDILTKNLIASIYFIQDHRRYFLFKINDELDIMNLENKEITSQDIEEMIKEKFKEFNYKKISYFLSEKTVTLTFDSPRTVAKEFDQKAEKFLAEYGIQIEKNNNINNLACENKIKDILGSSNIDKISYLPNLDIFRIKTHTDCTSYASIIKEEIGYDTEFVITTPKNKPSIREITLTGQKLEQNEAFQYIDNYFASKEDRPYKKSLKNGIIVLSFITYEVAMRYQKDIEQISNHIKYQIEINKSPNINELFSILSDLLTKYNITKVKSPSYLPALGKVSIKVNKTNSTIQLKEDFLTKTGLELIVEEI